jgi:Fe-S-cluster-containing hydrogenase component 2
VKNKQWHIEIDRGSCVQCAGCVSICPTRALGMQGLTLACDDPACIGCDLCVIFCPVTALQLEPRGVIPASTPGREPARLISPGREIAT